MLKIKSLLLTLSLSSVFLGAWQLPNQAQLSQSSPSKGAAGSVSGNNSGSITIFSLPVNVQTDYTTTSGNILVKMDSTGTVPIIIVPSAVQNAVNTSGRNVVVSFATGSLTQQEIAGLVLALPTNINSIQQVVPGGFILQVGGNQGKSFPTLGAAFLSLITSISSLPNNGYASLQIGNKKIVISNPEK